MPKLHAGAKVPLYGMLGVSLSFSFAYTFLDPRVCIGVPRVG
eukprot:gene41612-22865_t